MRDLESWLFDVPEGGAGLHWSFLNLWRKPLSLGVNCWRGGVPIEGEQEGESQPFRGWKG